MSMPTVASVRPGAAVSIVLKQDQPTGRQVQGVVQELLTKGNHPRGIKVRLQDGRIGRVQRMAIGPVAESNLDEVKKDIQAQQVARGSQGQYRSYRLSTRYTDVREEDNGDEPQTEMDLMAYVKEAKPKKNKNKSSSKDQPQSAWVKTMNASCPVCDSFEGDEAAVAHHVEEHFK